MTDGLFAVAESDIGIIAPYSAQCKKIRTLLKAKNPNTEINVGSAELFQGQVCCGFSFFSQIH